MLSNDPTLFVNIIPKMPHDEAARVCGVQTEAQSESDSASEVTWASIYTTEYNRSHVTIVCVQTKGV